MELDFIKNNGPADEMVERLMQLVGDICHPKIVREMILAALKAGQENKSRLELKIIKATLKEMRFTAKAFGPYRNTRKVSVFGSARIQPDNAIYKMARLFGRRLCEKGYMVITGGGPGIMQAVNEGAGPERSFGINIELPFGQKANPILKGNPRHVSYKYFFNRKLAFLKEADAVVLFPGGCGTLDEGMETIALVQTGKRDPMPIILMDKPGGTYWSRFLTFFESELMDQNYIKETDFYLFECVDSVEDAVRIIDRFYYRYHSLRYVGGRLVIRLTSELDPKVVPEIKDCFSDILTHQGNLFLSGPLPEEANEPELNHLPRLIVDFNRKDFGRLRGLINAINGY